MGTFEFQVLKVVLDVSVNSSEVDITIALALFGAMTVVLSPRINAIVAEQGLATAALKRALDDHSTNCTDEEIGLLFDDSILLDQIGDIQVFFVMLWRNVCCRFVGKAIWILLVQLVELFLGYFDGLLWDLLDGYLNRSTAIV